ncbi:MAG: LLM class flavin-dependent oxidoreductase [Nitriliruptorales bacterium]|nr:LLM class flavin-dependent oxidoreductase [Nitriliruptorales bacterium]
MPGVRVGRAAVFEWELEGVPVELGPHGAQPVEPVGCVGGPQPPGRWNPHAAHVETRVRTQATAAHGAGAGVRLGQPPRLIQEPRPPVWVPGGGSLETYDFALTNTYNYSYLSFYGYKYAKSVLDSFWRRADELGVERNPFQAAFAQFVLVSETDEKARQEYEEHVLYFYNKCMHINPRYVEAPGYRSARSTRNVLKARLEGTNRSGRDLLKSGFGWDELRAAGYIIAGSPETVRAELEAAARSLNVANVALLLQVGSAPHELTCKNTTLFATEVMPALREVFSEHDSSPFWPVTTQRVPQ